jgi:tripartite-type tricarboxylate transporter receptor subunit TctC
VAPRATEPSKPAATIAPAAAPTVAPTASPAPRAEAKPAEAKPVSQPTAGPTGKPAAKPAFDEAAVASFYRGKTVRIIVGVAAGGTFDLYARTVARHLPTYLPGNPTVIVENKTGAAGLVAANALYGSEPKDGTALASFNSSLVLQQVLGAPGVQFDAVRFNWLGSVTNVVVACAARADSGASTIQDTINGKQIAAGTIGPGTPSHDVPAVLNGALGTSFKLVPGYDGASKVHLAVEGKEVDGWCGGFESMTILDRELLEGPNPVARVLVVMGSQTPDHPFLRGVPAAETLAKTDETRQLLRAISGPDRISRAYVAPPDVPADRVAALRIALANTFADPRLLEDTRKQNQEVNPASGEEATRVVRDVLATPPSVLARLKEILK